jgi:hypothetical protein
MQQIYETAQQNTVLSAYNYSRTGDCEGNENENIRDREATNNTNNKAQTIQITQNKL